MTAPDPAVADLAAVLRRPGRIVLAAWLLAAALLLAAMAGTALARVRRADPAPALAAVLALDRPVTAPSGTPVRHPQTVRPGVRPEHVPAAPGVFDPARGAGR